MERSASFTWIQGCRGVRQWGRKEPVVRRAGVRGLDSGGVSIQKRSSLRISGFLMSKQPGRHTSKQYISTELIN
ncbi:hypothetical protein J6590_000282 [Homalodisca vitripennis]|nr:hypothetical protein J6590_000282 [Homalodisca vitripennis]